MGFPSALLLAIATSWTVVEVVVCRGRRLRMLPFTGELAHTVRHVHHCGQYEHHPHPHGYGAEHIRHQYRCNAQRDDRRHELNEQILHDYLSKEQQGLLYYKPFYYIVNGMQLSNLLLST